jgi:hypothetical protein
MEAIKARWWCNASWKWRGCGGDGDFAFVERVAELRNFHKRLAKAAGLGAYSCGNS